MVIKSRLRNGKGSCLRGESTQLDFFLLLAQVNPASLKVLNQVADAFGVGFGVTVAFERVRPPAGLNEDVRPDKPGLDVNGSDLGNADADFVLLKPGAFAADDRQFRDLNDGGKKKISPGPAAGCESFRRHDTMLVQEPR